MTSRAYPKFKVGDKVIIQEGYWSGCTAEIESVDISQEFNCFIYQLQIIRNSKVYYNSCFGEKPLKRIIKEYKIV